MGLGYEMQLTMSGVLNVCQVVACLWSLWGMDKFGRRKLLLGGGVCMVCGLSASFPDTVLTIPVCLSLHHCCACWPLPRQLASAHRRRLDVCRFSAILHADIWRYLGSYSMGHAG